jgi:hypothetical protein
VLVIPEGELVPGKEDALSLTLDELALGSADWETTFVEFCAKAVE